MLPVKAGSQRLSEEARLKLELFYRRFCEGENRARYGLGHLVFACHASFPLLLSPELANLIWLNFGSYASRRAAPSTTQQKIDAVTVSDFLLSPLVRPVANRQYEVLPEIRSYFLYLLKDSRWFNLFGIQTFGESRLKELADFILLYLQDKKAQRENEVTGFHQLNRWSALAWLDPDLLAKEMATALKDLLPAKEEDPEDERGQLRIYMMADRIGKQIGLDIHSKEAGSARLFLNFQRYTNANMLRLVGNNEVDLYDNYDRLEGDFISTRGGSDTEVMLPLKRGIGSRLYRNKNNIQRVIPLPILNGDESRSLFELFERQKVNGDIEFDMDYFNQSFNSNLQTHRNTFDDLELSLLLANDEDLLLMVALEGPYQSQLLPSLQSFIKDKRRNRCQLLLILDVPEFRTTKLVGDNDIQLWIPKSNETLYKILESVEKKLTYKDLFYLVQSSASETRPRFFLPENQWNNYFLRRQSPSRPHDDAYISYNKEQQRWDILPGDFNPVFSGAHTMVYTLTGDQVPDNMGGVIQEDESGVYLEGGDESLTDQYIYRIRPVKPPLEFNTNEEIPMIPIMPWSKWGDFKYIQEPAPLRIQQHLHIDDAIEISYYEDDSLPPIKWLANTAEEFADTLVKLNRWAYLKDLKLPDHDQAFEMMQHYYKDDRGGDQDILRLKTKDGVVAFDDLQINIIPYERFEYYVDIYLLLDDFTILHLSHSFAPQQPGMTVTFRISGDILPMKILTQDLGFTLKFLYSRDPIITDFSQEGRYK